MEWKQRLLLRKRPCEIVSGVSLPVSEGKQRLTCRDVSEVLLKEILRGYQPQSESVLFKNTVMPQESFEVTEAVKL